MDRPELESTIRKRKSLRFRILKWILPRLAYLASYLFFGTARIRHVDKQHFDKFVKRGRPIIWACYHQGVLLLPFLLRDPGLGWRIAMVSSSLDGDLIAETMRLFGQHAARGSSTRGGKRALQVMTEMLNRGNREGKVPHHGLFTVDGPQGPAGVTKIGAIKLAKETGLPVVPVNWWAWPRIQFRSWDRTILPLPFARLVIVYGEEIRVPPDATAEEMERLRGVLDRRLQDVLDRAKAASGRGGSR